MLFISICAIGMFWIGIVAHCIYRIPIVRKVFKKLLQ
jgi:hypothetical protein